MSTAPGSGVTGSPCVPMTRIGAAPSASRSGSGVRGASHGVQVYSDSAASAPNSGYWVLHWATRARTSDCE